MKSTTTKVHYMTDQTFLKCVKLFFSFFFHKIRFVHSIMNMTCMIIFSVVQFGEGSCHDSRA
jgi:hypothetical protein